MQKATLLAAALLMLGKVADAAPVTGQISLTGYAEAVGSVSMGSATGIDFADSTGTTVSGTSGTLTSYGGEYGSFAALGACATGSCGTIKDITSLTTSPPISQFFTLTTAGPTVSFDLASITNIRHDPSTDAMSFAATGIINFTGYDPTPAVFLLTAQANIITSFSATTVAVAAPEPASLAILGGSLAVIGLLRRNRARTTIAPEAST